ncbi:MAG: hypothetical protein AVDCRST_MAG68-5167 [uncultured Gemmatimonadetes bacterium]|uniref:Uncharacterized protein n=1 Tax=uncultured Gemmatimonadota bacterium TaxID=203437 RepID=A0A6J4MS08_9BACT|nr:MAG: hypothetical protein AVDCRST_MAG68-5167 [uncultured Gemmatimonadota bacterium]
MLAVTKAAALIKTHRMPYWHRPRWAIVDPFFGLQIARWCPGPELVRSHDRKGRELLSADRLEVGQTLCRQCEANALDAGLPPTNVDPFVLVPLRLIAGGNAA